MIQSEILSNPFVPHPVKPCRQTHLKKKKKKKPHSYYQLEIFLCPKGSVLFMNINKYGTSFGPFFIFILLRIRVFGGVYVFS